MILEGAYIRLEPLEQRHAEGLAAASANDSELYRWSAVPQTPEAVIRYIDAAQVAVPFAVIRLADERVIGSTRFWLLEKWAWPEGHPRSGKPYDACEIGHTWYTRAAIRTAANTEAKLLMLTHAFERWEMLRVCLHTDARNERSRTAIDRMGARFEGILRAHRMAADFTPRDSARFSILAEEWPGVKQRLSGMLKK
jgi:RimJ/RimL family protein N-acetyltransferase